MGCSLGVLTTVKEYEAEDFKDTDDRYDHIMELKAGVEEGLQDSHSGNIDYFKDCEPDMSEDSSELILGCERPEELKKIVRNWNDSIRNLCANKFMELEKFMKEQGYDSLSDFIRGYADENGCLKPTQYPASIYELRKTLDALDNHFSYGCYGDLVYIEDTIGTGEYMTYDQVTLPSEIRKDVEEHPERYMYIELVYD